MFQARFPVALCGILLCAMGAMAKENEFRFPEGKIGNKAELKYHNNIPVLVVSGSSDEIGKAVAKLAIKPAKKVLGYPKDVLGEFYVGFLWNKVVETGKKMLAQFPKPYQKELEAMAKESGDVRDQLIAGNTIFDIKKIINCSALMIDADRSATKGPLLARNLDYPSLGYIHKYSLVTVYRPTGKHAWASLGFPGLIGCISGMNDAGLTVAVLEVFGARKGEGRFNSKGIPYALCYRKLLEECTTIKEAKKMLEGMPRTAVMNLVVADRNGTGVFEITPKSVMLRRGKGGITSCTNHFCTELKADKQPNLANTFERFDYLERTRAQKTPVTIGAIHRKLHMVSLGSQTLQTMIFEPKTLTLHVAFGKGPSTQFPLRTIKLGPLMKKGVAGAKATTKKSGRIAVKK